MQKPSRWKQSVHELLEALECPADALGPLEEDADRRAQRPARARTCC